MDVDHDLVLVDEFDALSIELKVASRQPPTASRLPPAEKEKLRIKEQLNHGWLHENLGKYPAKQHAKKVARELGVDSGLIYLSGQHELLYEDSDMGPEFHQRRYFFYITGADFPGCAVTYDIQRDHLILWIPYIEPRKALYYGTAPSAEEFKAASDVDDVCHIAGLQRFLRSTLSPGSTLYILHPDQAPNLGCAQGPTPRIDSVSLAPAMASARVIKTDYEIAMIRRANAISSAAHKLVLTRLKKLTNECELDALFRGFCMSRGAKHQAYPVIAASGPAAATLHYFANDQPLAGRQLVVLDAGCEWNCYASDITRTFPVSGRFTPEAAAVYAAVERMQNACIARVRPGVAYHVLHLHACAVAVGELLRLKILHNGTPSEIFKTGTVAAFFPHGLGHHVGLEVHDVSGKERLLLAEPAEWEEQAADVSNLSPWDCSSSARWRHQRHARTPRGKREWLSPEMLVAMYREATGLVGGDTASSKGQKLEKGMVVTIEPGIYFCRPYIQAYFLDNPQHAKYINTAELEKYWDVGGVRIEDDILVTEDGYENLTTAPKGKEMLDIINASD
ncbi:Creatinase/aminopeptidase [Canariomyces notabilis]|uniref:Xaa-Pro aminopeptidase n=1 Tax=Canariomyces notabilis TaxID=2074819 RepID=A0AAN6YWD0_9PEZI|nr:Creatinase/aminopeptidase [Canariomyces arenarius]